MPGAIGPARAGVTAWTIAVSARRSAANYTLGDAGLAFAGFVAAGRLFEGVTSITKPDESRRAKRPRSSLVQAGFAGSTCFVVMSFPRCCASRGDDPDDGGALRQSHPKEPSATRHADHVLVRLTPARFLHSVMWVSEEPVRVTTSYLPQSVGATMARIAAGFDPWVAYSDFLEDWTYSPDARPRLVAKMPTFRNPEEQRWAALLAASVEALCERDGLAAPAWTRDPSLRLSEPWYLYDGTGRIREWLRESTPQPFASRNIWSGDRVLRRA